MESDISAVGAVGMLATLGAMMLFVSAYPGEMNERLRYGLRVLAVIHFLPILVRLWIAVITG